MLNHTTVQLQRLKACGFADEERSIRVYWANVPHLSDDVVLVSTDHCHYCVIVNAMGKQQVQEQSS